RGVAPDDITPVEAARQEVARGAPGEHDACVLILRVHTDDRVVRDDAVLRGQQTFRVAWHDVDAHPAVPDPVVHDLDVVPAVRIDTRPGLDVLDVVPGHQDVLTAGSLGVVQVAARDTVGVHQRRGHEQAAHGVVQDLTTLARDHHDARVLTIGQGVLGDVEVLHP